MCKQSLDKLEALQKQLEPGERVEAAARFSCAAEIIGFLLLSAAALLAGRWCRSGPLTVLLHFVPMLLMADAAQALYRVQNSCVLVTNRRTFGTCAGKPFDIPHRRLIRVIPGRTLFLDAGDARSSVIIRHLSNRSQVCSAISRYRDLS